MHVQEHYSHSRCGSSCSISCPVHNSIDLLQRMVIATECQQNSGRQTSVFASLLGAFRHRNKHHLATLAYEGRCFASIANCKSTTRIQVSTGTHWRFNGVPSPCCHADFKRGRAEHTTHLMGMAAEPFEPGRRWTASAIPASLCQAALLEHGL